MNERQSTDRLAVYTSIFGPGYQLPEIPGGDNVDYICFTDQPLPKNDSWSIRQTPPLLPADPARSSRDPKIRAHRYLESHKNSLYIDPSVVLKEDPYLLWKHLIGPSELTCFGAMNHSYRECLEDEFKEVSRSALDDEWRINEQENTYEHTDSDYRGLKPVWGGILARKHHDPSCIEAMEMWYAHVLRYTRRDQLSLPIALKRLGLEQKRFTDDDNKHTRFHSWPSESYVRPQGYYDQVLSTALESFRASAGISPEHDSCRKAIEILEAQRGTLLYERDRAIELIKTLEGSRLMRWKRNVDKLISRIRRSKDEQ